LGMAPGAKRNIMYHGCGAVSFSRPVSVTASRKTSFH
jgi:hypothetical protein